MHGTEKTALMLVGLYKINEFATFFSFLRQVLVVESKD